jgi:pimeloyl-ACP methyl ester carboxylesterase
MAPMRIGGIRRLALSGCRACERQRFGAPTVQMRKQLMRSILCKGNDLPTLPTLETFDSDGVSIAYLDAGGIADGEKSGSTDDLPPVLLIHGFASNHRINWVSTGWVRALSGIGRRVIALDNRGHGASEKLYDPKSYPATVMADDARRLLDHLDLAQADVVGYSMGARITAFLALRHGKRVRRAVFGGLGENMILGIGGSQPIADALLAPSVGAISAAGPRAFRLFAEQTGSDRRALAACILASRQKISAAELAGLPVPVLVAVGENDEVGGNPDALAAHIPGAQAFTIPGRDHMKAVGDRAHMTRVLAFLQE